MTEQPAGGKKPVYCGKHKWLHSYTAWGDLNKPIQCSSRAKMTVFEKLSMVSFCWHRLVGVHLILFNSSTWRLLFCLYTKLPWIGTKHTSAAQETQQETHSLWIEPWKKKKKGWLCPSSHPGAQCGGTRWRQITLIWFPWEGSTELFYTQHNYVKIDSYKSAMCTSTVATGGNDWLSDSEQHP